MQSTKFLASAAMLAVLVGNAALAGEGKHDRAHDRQRVTDTDRGDSSGQGMAVVPNPAGPQERGHGWQYFSDPATRRAVVISPQGDYYYSRGKGMRWVTGVQSGV